MNPYVRAAMMDLPNKTATVLAMVAVLFREPFALETLENYFVESDKKKVDECFFCLVDKGYVRRTHDLKYIMVLR